MEVINSSLTILLDDYSNLILLSRRLSNSTCDNDTVKSQGNGQTETDRSTKKAGTKHQLHVCRGRPIGIRIVLIILLMLILIILFLPIFILLSFIQIMLIDPFNFVTAILGYGGRSFSSIAGLC